MSTDGYTRVYTEGGTVVHLLGSGQSPNYPDKALCGRTPWPGLWHGTGSQGEAERALEVPLCVSCWAVVMHQRGGA